MLLASCLTEGASVPATNCASLLANDCIRKFLIDFFSNEVNYTTVNKPHSKVLKRTQASAATCISPKPELARVPPHYRREELLCAPQQVSGKKIP
tara:strand:+ start:142 stop:426 length:285 start_codon:yes stop_codon:yes gene_type:complete